MSNHDREKKICPNCECEYRGEPAISRFDNETEICPDCGLAEALMDFFNKHS